MDVEYGIEHDDMKSCFRRGKIGNTTLFVIEVIDVFLLVCTILSLALFIYAGFIAIKMIQLINRPRFQQDDSGVVYLAWKAGGMVVCGVIVIVAGMWIG